MNNCSGTHRARLKRDVEGSSPETPAPQDFRGTLDRHDLSMPQWRFAVSLELSPRPTICPWNTTSAPTGTSPIMDASLAKLGLTHPKFVLV